MPPPAGAEGQLRKTLVPLGVSISSEKTRGPRVLSRFQRPQLGQVGDTGRDPDLRLCSLPLGLRGLQLDPPEKPEAKGGQGVPSRSRHPPTASGAWDLGSAHFQGPTLLGLHRLLEVSAAPPIPRHPVGCPRVRAAPTQTTPNTQSWPEVTANVRKTFRKRFGEEPLIQLLLNNSPSRGVWDPLTLHPAWRRNCSETRAPRWVRLRPRVAWHR